MAYKDLNKRRKYQREYHRVWRKENPEKVKEISKKYCDKNREKLRVKGMENYGKNKEREKLRNRIYHDENREKIRLRKLEYRKKPEVKKRININQKKSRIKNVKKNSVRDKTKHLFSLKGKKCKFCNSKAIHRHHHTTPYKFDKFWCVCRECHRKIHKEGQDVFLEK